MLAVVGFRVTSISTAKGRDRHRLPYLPFTPRPATL